MMKLYLKFLSIHFRSAMQYKTSFLLTVIGQFLSSFTVFIGITFMFARFDTVRGYTYNEVLLCFASILTSFSLAECFARGMDTFPSILANGEFDRILVRPRGAVFQVFASKMEFTRIGRLVQAFLVFAYAIPTCGVTFTADKIAVLVLMILCGALVFSGTFVLYAVICFWTTEGLEFMNIVTDGVREYGKYPFAVYGRGVLMLLTFVIPYALVQYYPFLYLLGRAPSPLYALTPLLSLLYLVPCAILWRIGVRHYRSTGS
jgi:ABC-2 type transport system permease protein